MPPVSSAAPASVTVTGGRVEAPKLIASPSAIYPATARANHVEGVVVMDALVDATGKVDAGKSDIRPGAPATGGHGRPALLEIPAGAPRWTAGGAAYTQVSISFRLQ